MKTTRINLVILSASFDETAVESVCGRHQSHVETQQIATYSISDSMAIITALEPVFATQVHLPLPLNVPVSDLGSGLLTEVVVNVDTLSAYASVCPRPAYTARRINPEPSINFILADYTGLC